MNYENEQSHTFLQGFGLTSNDALNCRLCAAVKMVLGRLGPRRPSLCRPGVPSTTKSSVTPKIGREMIQITDTNLEIIFPGQHFAVSFYIISSHFLSLELYFKAFWPLGFV